MVSTNLLLPFKNPSGSIEHYGAQVVAGYQLENLICLDHLGFNFMPSYRSEHKDLLLSIGYLLS